MRMIGMLLIALTGVFLGMMASMNLKKRRDALEQMEKLIVWLDSRIRYTAAPVRELLLSASRNEDFGTLSFLKTIGERLDEEKDLPKVWERAVLEQGRESGFLPTDRELLMEFGRGLGASDLDGQATHCRLYRELFQKQAETARQEVTVKGRLYITLGIAGGAGLALLL